MEDRIRKHLAKMRKVNQIDENNKLDTTENDINIYIPTFMNWVKRKVRGDGGIRSTLFLHKMYRDLEKDCNDIVVANSHIHDNFLLSIANELKNNVEAINRFKQHYVDNANILADLDCLINDVILHLQKKIYDYLKKE